VIQRPANIAESRLNILEFGLPRHYENIKSFTAAWRLPMDRHRLFIILFGLLFAEITLIFGVGGERATWFGFGMVAGTSYFVLHMIIIPGMNVSVKWGSKHE